jgi:hypothetical protein
MVSLATIDGSASGAKAVYWMELSDHPLQSVKNTDKKVIWTKGKNFPSADNRSQYQIVGAMATISRLGTAVAPIFSKGFERKHADRQEMFQLSH